MPPAKSFSKAMLPIDAVEIEPTVKPTSPLSKRTKLLAVIVSLCLLFFAVVGLTAYHFDQPESGTDFAESVSATIFQTPPVVPIGKSVTRTNGVGNVNSLSKPLASMANVMNNRKKASLFALGVAISLFLCAAIITTAFFLARQTSVGADTEDLFDDPVVVEPNNVNGQEANEVADGNSNVLKWVLAGLVVYAVVGLVVVVEGKCRKIYRDATPLKVLKAVSPSTKHKDVYERIQAVLGSNPPNHPDISYEFKERQDGGITHIFTYKPSGIPEREILNSLEVALYALHSHKSGTPSFKVPIGISVEERKYTFGVGFTVTINCPKYNSGRLRSPELEAFWNGFVSTMNSASSSYLEKIAGKLNPKLS